MWLFRKLKPKPKRIKHELQRVCMLADKDFYRAVECKICGQQYLMDVLGGWSIPWKFEVDWMKIEEKNMNAALDRYHKTPSREWIMIDEDECPGPKGSESNE